MPYGTDYSQQDRFTRAVGQFNQSEMQGAQAIGALKDRWADKQNTIKVMKWVAEQNISKKTPKEVADIAAEAGYRLSMTNGPFAHDLAENLHRTFQTRLAAEPKMDMTPTIRERVPMNEAGKPSRTVTIGQTTRPVTEQYNVETGQVTGSGLGEPFTAPSPFAGEGGVAIVKAKADSKRDLARAQKTITDFESTPKLIQNYQKILSDPEFNDAVKGGDVDLATAIIAKLVGDTTPQKTITRRYMDYIKAVNDEEGQLAYLKELGEDSEKLRRKKPAASKAGTVDQFIKEFEQEYSRKPTDIELQRAKGKYY